MSNGEIGLQVNNGNGEAVTIQKGDKIASIGLRERVQSLEVVLEGRDLEEKAPTKKVK